jgi:hypothetical protein
MKNWTVIVKILAALAAVAGVIYVIATYGDKIVAWAKKLLGCDPCADCDCECEECDCIEAEECDCIEAAEEAAEEETVVAAEDDFEG